MFSKPLSLALVYVLTIFNFLILTLPFLIVAYPFMDIDGDRIIFSKFIAINLKMALLLLIFVISFLMICYLFLDFLLGFSLKSLLKGCKEYNQCKNYIFLQDVFEEVKFKFSSPSTKLCIKDSDEINAFAVGGIRKKVIVITSGLINHYAIHIKDDQQFLFAIRSILGHEMSHLINKDFLPSLLVMLNRRMTNFISNILGLLFRFSMQFTTFFRIQNRMTAIVMLTIYNIVNRFFNFFNRCVIDNVYCFLKNFLGRAVEYRCDRQSAKAFGGINMAFALSLLGKSGYFTLFSTHPATARRIKKVEVVEEKNAIIKASLSSTISNFISIIILLVICLYTAHLSGIDMIIQFYTHYYYPEVYDWLSGVINSISALLKTFLS